MSELSFNVEIPSFKDAYFKKDDEETRKAEAFSLKMSEKKRMMSARIGELESRLADLNLKLSRSFSDPGIDTAQIYCQILASEEELAINRHFMEKLFPA